MASVVDEGDGALGTIYAILRVSHVEHGRLGRSILGTDNVSGRSRSVGDRLSTDAGAVMCDRGFFFGRRLTPLRLLASSRLLSRAGAPRLLLLRLLSLRYGHLRR